MCDVWPGVATDLDTMATTEPYYRSSYVFVTRRDRRLDIRSFDDPRLKTLAIGVQMIGNDATNTPPAHALARRGIVTNVRGFMIYDAGADSSPIVAGVADGTLDVAIVWGPTAGYFARRANVALAIAPTPKTDAGIPMTFAISMGVRKGNAVLRNAIDDALRARKPDITQILQRFGVPMVTVGDSAASPHA
jgi:mxaJ protein